MENKRVKEIYKVTLVGFALNFFLVIGKLVAGILGRSGAMIADAVHSVSDFATDFVVLFFVKLSAKPKDEDHDYGHGKFETLASIIIGLALLIVGVGIIISGSKSIFYAIKGEILPQPGVIAIYAALISILSKEWMYRYTIKVGKKVNSSSLKANAWHHRSDAFSSVGTLIGIAGAHFLGGKWGILDPIAAIIVGVLIVRVALSLIKTGVSELMEKSLPADVEEEILSIIKGSAEVCDPHDLRTRRIGANIAIDVHICMDSQITVGKAHTITDNIESRLRSRFGSETMISIHVEPLLA